MDNFTEKYLKYKEARDIQNAYFNFKNKGKLVIKCSNCGRKVSLNGCTSHHNICPSIYYDKFKFIIDNFNGYSKSIISDDDININHNSRLDRWYIVVSNQNEWSKLNNYIYRYENHYKKCKFCDSGFINKNSEFCSKSCSVKNYHKRDKGTDDYAKRCDNISKTRILKNIKQSPWNKGMIGDEYMKHYDKEDGTNSLINSLKNNINWFKKTSIESKIEELLIKLNIEYKYCYYYNTQFDFKTTINDKIVFIEVDGDYWHKSSRRCRDSNIRSIKRLDDRMKDYYIMNNKKCYIIRFWEYNINNNINIIESYLNELKKSNDNNFKFIIDEIKEYYEKNS